MKNTSAGLLLLLCCLSGLYSSAQDLRYLNKNSYYTYIYRIPADTILRLYDKADDFDKNLSGFTLIDSFRSGSGYDKVLPAGHYYEVSVIDRKVHYSYNLVSDLMATILADLKYNKLYIRSKGGEPVINAIVTFHKKKFYFNDKAHAYLIPFSNEDGRTLTIEANGEKLFYDYTTDDKEKPDRADRKEKRLAAREGHRTIKPNGYIVFNKPKYQPGDTVLLKAYLLHSNNRAYNIPLQVRVRQSYAITSSDYMIVSSRLEPVTPGAYLCSFVVTDSFQIDRSYDLSFVEPTSGVVIQTGQFQVEDYLLDRYTYTFTVERRQWDMPVTDTIRMIAAGHDATGMNAMDSRVRITAISSYISDWHTDHDCIPDTLFVIERQLAATGDTRLDFPLEWLPDVTMRMDIHADFTNGAGEHQSMSQNVTINRSARSISVYQEEDSIYAELLAGGHSVAGQGRMLTVDDDGEDISSRLISFPFHVRVDPFADRYSFDAYGRDTIHTTFDPRGGSQYLYFRRTDSAITLLPDTRGTLHFYTLYHGGVVVSRGMVSDQPVVIEDRTRHEYTILVQYVEGGASGYRSYAISAPYRHPQLEVHQRATVYPGQRDSVTITVSDRRGHPMSGMNITALSYNDQFHRGVHLSYSRYPRSWGSDAAGIRESDIEPIDVSDAVIDIGTAPYWISRAHLDTMLYYQLVFPRHGRLERVTPAPGLTAQFAPFIFDHGRSVGIHMVYVDGALAYYDGTAPYTAYSIPAADGRHRISLRTSERMVHIDSVPLHDSAKTDLILEWDSIRGHGDTLSSELSLNERKLLSSRFIYYQQQRNNDTSYIWQNNNPFYFTLPPSYSASASQIFIPIGPLSYEQANFYAPHNFVVPFDPERYYAFSFNPAVARLQSFDLFAAPHLYLARYADGGRIRFGELLRSHPAVDLSPAAPSSSALFHTSDIHGRYGENHHLSELKLRVVSDSSISYIRIYRTDSMTYDRIFAYSRNNGPGDLTPGVYSVIAYTASGYYHIERGISVAPYAVCHHTVRPRFFEPPLSVSYAAQMDTAGLRDKRVSYMRTPGSMGIAGKVCNNNGTGIPYVTVILTDAQGQPVGRNTITDKYGYYSLPDLPSRSCQLQFSTTGYQDAIVANVNIATGRSAIVCVRMLLARPLREIPLSSSQLGEVDVTRRSYERKLMSESVSMSVVQSYSLYKMSALADTTELAAAIQKTPGVMINGGRSDEVIYLVNGQRVVGNVNIVTGTIGEGYNHSENVMAKYGDASSGAINIDSAYKDASKLRKDFRDYAYWEPNLITDENGKASFVAKYPDNVTTWHSFTIAMNARHQAATADKLVRSYKECLAELATPQFLIAGDSSSAAIKITDYLRRPVSLHADFIWDGSKVQENNVTVTDILTDEVPVTISPLEKRPEVKASFNISTKGGFGDGEERRIAVLPQGTKETTGIFALLRGDTSVTLPIDTSSGTVTIRAESDILDVLLDEIDHVRKYPYWCMEQTASRLIMLTMLEKINASLGKPFKLQKEKTTCITKLQKGQLVTGAYGWWEYSTASVRLTTYVLSALGKANVTAAVNINDAYGYLDAAFGLMSREEKLNTLELYAERKYNTGKIVTGLRSISFDSLTLYQQLQYHKAELLVGYIDTFHHWDRIMAKRQRTIFGGSYWGDDTWYWYSNQASATVLAYEIATLRRDNVLQDQIIQYFLERRTHSGWRNTAESAKIVSAILPKVLADRHGSLAAPSLSIDGAPAITAFPYQGRMVPLHSSMSIVKKGGAPVYFTAYQTVFNPAPSAVSTDFDITTTFQRSGSAVAHLTAAESAEIVVDIRTKKYCEYLMIEVPIPAGCTYGPKPQGYGNTEVHREYFRDRVVIFCEAFHPGHQQFHIPVEARYHGSYTVNPAKVQLMYFPTFFGRTGMKRISIR